MRVVTKIAISSLFALSVSLVAAQAGPGPGAGQGKGPRWNSDNTPGWSLMTPEERQSHQQRMASMKTRDECRAYIAEHHKLMTARAEERGRKAVAQPRRDPCAGVNP